MKKTLFTLVLAAFGFLAQAQKYESFGEKISDKDALPAKVLVEESGTLEKKNLKLEGEVESVCQMAGCWMKVKTADGKTVRVSFKDYGFFVPTDIAGRKVVFEGEPGTKVVSVEDQQTAAKKAGKTEEEISKITTPRTDIVFVANGVLVPKK
ncbi:DUF4920 domain-containing protein [Emticicia sp. CRIBPO]|jgi:hypothetical protein|uniref:DUF4920 domain-containing protein n=1 Tax=Emticicia sp. CRIBPO TaxID=2683258 RepID=UPI00141324C8|nr:DUF4920 domain-containing protein [Emticicia sp. CRIBPO]NBA84185.1 DUF4920 domain-containing protein [Emticicia sp. CRIBPO]